MSSVVKDGRNWRVGTAAEVAWIILQAPMVTMYAGWHYVLVQAGLEQAATWRQPEFGSFWKGPLPNLMFPSRPVLAGFHAVGRRLDLHRRAGRARAEVPAPP